MHYRYQPSPDPNAHVFRGVMHTEHIVYLAPPVAAVEKFLCTTHLGMFWLIAKLTVKEYARNIEAGREIYWLDRVPEQGSYCVPLLHRSED